MAGLRRGRRGGRRSRTIRRVISFLLLVAAGALAAVDPGHSTAAGLAALAVVRDLPAGATLGPGDVAVVLLGARPDGAVRTAAEATGRLLAGAVRRGEVLTDLRLVTPSGPEPGAGRVAVPIRLVDSGTVDLLSPGIHVALLSVSETGAPTVLATDAVVLKIQPPGSRPATEKRMVVLAVPRSAADRITAAAVTGTLAIRFT